MKFYTSNLGRNAFFLLLFLLGATPLFSQTDLASPYSRFGPGIISKKQSAQQFGMGGAGIALYDPYKINLLNPASYAFHVSPIFEVGGIGDLSTYKTSQSEVEANSFKINNLSLNFPVIRNKMGLAFGLVPYSTVGYKTSDVQEFDGYNYTAEYQGEGGINQVYLGTAYRLFTNVDSLNNVETLSFGVNLNYYFGSIDNNRSTIFDVNYMAQSLRSEKTTTTQDINFDFGITYQRNLIKRTENSPRFLKFTIGATYSLESDLKSTRKETAFNYNSTGIKDTVLAFSEKDGFLRLPQQFGVGIALDYISNKKQRLRFAADYSGGEWSNYKESFGREIAISEFTDNKKYNVGLEFTPDISSMKLLERIEYRAGFRYETSNLTVFEENLEDYGISFGLSTPINFKRAYTRSTFNVGVEYGQYGTTDKNLIQQEYVRFLVGLTLTPHFRNIWLNKRKYD